MRCAVRSPRALRRCESGAAAIEFSIIGVVMILVLLGIIEFGRGLLVRNEISYLADMGSRMVLLDPAIPDDTLRDEVRAEFSGDRARLGITIVPEEIEGMAYRTVSITYPMTLLVPGLSSRVLSLNVTRRVPAG